MTITYPDEFTAATLHSVWTQVHDSGASDLHPSEQTMLADLSNVRLIDAEGANYVALIPHILQAHGKKVSICLPSNANVLRFLDALGVLEHLYRNFAVQPGTYIASSTAPQVLDPLIGRNVRLIPRALQTTVFTSATVPSVFREEVIRHHLYALDEATANTVCCCVYELVANVMHHSEQTVGCLTIQFRAGGKAPRIGQLFVAVSDLGIGIRQSLLKRREGDVDLRSDADDEACLRYAVQPGTSRFGLDVRGHGLPTVLGLADMVHLSSGKASLYNDRRKSVQKSQPLTFLQGTSALLVFDVHKQEEDETNNASHCIAHPQRVRKR